MDGPRWLIGATTLGVLLVVAGVVAVTGPGGGDETPTTTSVISDEVVDEFLVDFEASLTGTFVVESTFQRLRADQVVANAETTVVQRPPDQLTIRGTSISGRLDGRAVTCSDSGCLVGSEPVEAEAEVAQQVATMRDYVDGPELLYGVSAVETTEVTRRGGETDRCYTLDLLRALPVAPYGTFARFCFDAPTGAPTLLRIERPEAIDVTTARSVRADVTADDLELPT